MIIFSRASHFYAFLMGLTKSSDWQPDFRVSAQVWLHEQADLRIEGRILGLTSALGDWVVLGWLSVNGLNGAYGVCWF
jgi:hypothetical protein